MSTKYDDQKVSKVSDAWSRLPLVAISINIVCTRYHLRILNDLNESFAMNNKWRVYFLQSKINRFKSVSLFILKMFANIFPIFLFVPKAHIEWRNGKKVETHTNFIVIWFYLIDPIKCSIQQWYLNLFSIVFISLGFSQTFFPHYFFLSHSLFHSDFASASMYIHIFYMFSYLSLVKA